MESNYNDPEELTYVDYTGKRRHLGYLFYKLRHLEKDLSQGSHFMFKHQAWGLNFEHFKNKIKPNADYVYVYDQAAKEFPHSYLDIRNIDINNPEIYPTGNKDIDDKYKGSVVVRQYPPHELQIFINMRLWKLSKTKLTHQEIMELINKKEEVVVPQEVPKKEKNNQMGFNFDGRDN